jgi:serine O-acetyltransferase
MSLRSELRRDVARQLERPEPTTFQAVTCLVQYRGMQATAAYRLARWCACHHLRIMAEVLSRVSQLLFTVDIAYQADIGPGFVLRHPADIVIGRGCRVGCDVTMFNGVTLGNRFSGSADRPDGSPIIGDRVFIGTGAKILGPVEVGSGATVGANAVVTRSVPPGAVVAGNPSRIVAGAGKAKPVEHREDTAAELADLRRRLEDLERRFGGTASPG